MLAKLLLWLTNLKKIFPNFLDKTFSRSKKTYWLGPLIYLKKALYLFYRLGFLLKRQHNIDKNASLIKKYQKTFFKVLVGNIDRGLSDCYKKTSQLIYRFCVLVNRQLNVGKIASLTQKNQKTFPNVLVENIDRGLSVCYKNKLRS